jgi:hypothetical protein
MKPLPVPKSISYTKASETMGARTPDRPNACIICFLLLGPVRDEEIISFLRYIIIPLSGI